MKEERIVLVYLIFTLVFAGGILLRKKNYRAPVAAALPTSAVKSKPAPRYAYQPIPRSSVPKAPNKAATVRRMASIPPRNIPHSRALDTRRRSSPRTSVSMRSTAYSRPVTPAFFNPPAYDEDHDLSQKLDELDYQERKEVEFLKMKVGLSEGEIHTLAKKRNDYLAQLQLFNTQEQQGSKAASLNKKSLTHAHIQWMANYLGPENYYEFLNLAAE